MSDIPGADGLMPTTSDEGPQLRSVGRYHLLEEVGAGGMGIVYRARDPLLDRIVAVKLPHFEGPSEQYARRVQRFQREARAAARVLHPHVCPIYDVGEQDGQPFVVMAFLEGPSLARRLTDSGRFEDVGAAVRVVLQLLEALAAVHAHGIVHRDLKPGNVMFDAQGGAVLTDFGLARPEEAEPLTSEGAIPGTPAYMAPEQAAGQSDRVGPWTDLYSLGVVLYQMVTGRLPFEGAGLAVLHRLLHEDPPAPTRFRPDLDPALEAVILQALRKDPGDRFRNAGDFVAALTGSITPIAGSSVRPPATTEQPTPPGVRKSLCWTPLRVLGWAAGYLLLLGAAGFLAYLPGIVTEHLDGVPLGLMLSPFVLMMAATGVAIWGWVEALHVPEALGYFARNGLVGWARRALSNGVPVNFRNDLGETPLLIAVIQGQPEMVKLLLLSGANPTIPDRLGQTPLSAARAKGYGEIVDALERYSRAANSSAVDDTPVWHPNARLHLLLATALGAAFVIAASYSTSTRARQITGEDFTRLLEGHQVKRVILGLRKQALGEVKDPEHPDVLPLRLTNGKFSAELDAKKQFDLIQREAFRTGLQYEQIGGGLGLTPDLWTVLAMLACPIGLLSVCFQPLIGSRSRFPFLALRGKSPRRPGGLVS
jgi:hypothetical protein